MIGCNSAAIVKIEEKTEHCSSIYYNLFMWYLQKKKNSKFLKRFNDAFKIINYTLFVKINCLKNFQIWVFVLYFHKVETLTPEISFSVKGRLIITKSPVLLKHCLNPTFVFPASVVTYWINFLHSSALILLILWMHRCFI